MYKITMLSLEDAKTLAQAAEEKAIELGVRVVIAIMDQHGNLKYYRRMDGNNAVSVKVAQLKANTSSMIPISTKALAERNAGIVNGPYLGVPGLVLLEGGLPFFTKEGEHIGSIGVSGASSDIDGICAMAAVTALQKLNDKR